MGSMYTAVQAPATRVDDLHLTNQVTIVGGDPIASALADASAATLSVVSDARRFIDKANEGNFNLNFSL